MGHNIYKLEKREKQRDRNKAPCIKDILRKAWYNDHNETKETKMTKGEIVRAMLAAGCTIQQIRAVTGLTNRVISTLAE